MRALAVGLMIVLGGCAVAQQRFDTGLNQQQEEVSIAPGGERKGQHLRAIDFTACRGSREASGQLVIDRRNCSLHSGEFVSGELIRNVRVVHARDQKQSGSFYSVSLSASTLPENQAYVSEDEVRAARSVEDYRNDPGVHDCAKHPEPRIGMSWKAALASCWGDPIGVNKTQTRGRIHQQLVYEGGKYLYLTDGIVTAIQRF